MLFALTASDLEGKIGGPDSRIDEAGRFPIIDSAMGEPIGAPASCPV